MTAINIKKQTADGRPYPDFLLDHIKTDWVDVDIPLVDPDICLKVDSSLAYCGCGCPGPKLRQFVYLYQQSTDFDHETIALLARIGAAASEDSEFWDDVLVLELQRDCGLSRADYLTALTAIVAAVEAEQVWCEALLTA